MTSTGASAVIPRPLNGAFSLPGGEAIGVWVGIHLEYWSLAPPEGSFVVRGMHGNWPDHFPDYRTHSFREYGNRVGVFRLMDVLREIGLPFTMIVNAEALARCAAVVAEAAALGADFVLQGRIANRLITAAMSEDEEASEIGHASETYRSVLGRPPDGWMGPEGAESMRTPALLAKSGFSFVLDWPNRDTPAIFPTSPALVSIPYQWDLDDLDLLWGRNARAWHYPRIIFSAFAELYESGGATSVLGLHVRPWLMGQPSRIRYFAEALGRLHEQPNVAFMTASSIAARAAAVDNGEV